MRHVAKVNQSSAAIHNRRLTIQLLQQYGAMSRRQLAQITGLRTSTLTYIVRDLIQQHIVRTVGKAVSKKVGKKQILLEINPDKGWVMGVGLETTAATLVYVDASGKVIGHERVEVGSDANALPNLLRARIDSWAVKNNKRMEDLLGIGVGVPGVVDNARGHVLRSTCFHTEDLPLRGLLAEQFDTPVRVDNNANYAAQAEFRMGNARDLTNFVCFLMDVEAEDDGFAVRGQGSTIFLDGRLYRGTHFAAGEVDTLLEAEPHIKISREQLRLMAKPDAPIDDTMRRVARQAGRTLTAVVDLIDPQAVLLGGNMAISNRQMIAEIGREMNKKLVKVPNREVSIRPSGLVDRGVSVGAAIAAIDAALKGDDPTQSACGFQELIRDVLGDPDLGKEQP